MKSNQYSLVNHTILPLIYRVLHPQIQRITYLLRDPKTNSLLMLGSSSQTLKIFLNTQKNSLQEIENESKSKLKYIFFNSSESQVNAEKYIPTQRKQQIFTAQIQGDLKPLIVGEHSVCFIDAKGYKNPFSLIAVTHLTQASTKIPVLFTGSLISPCSVDFKDKEVKAKDYLSSLDKVKFFPSETYIFPSCTVSEEDLLFAKAVVQNPFIDEKIKLFAKNKNFGDALLPTTVLEQKMMNPYLNCYKYKDLLGTSDKQKAFTLLRRMRQEFKINE